MMKKDQKIFNTFYINLHIFFSKYIWIQLGIEVEVNRIWIEINSTWIQLTLHAMSFDISFAWNLTAHAPLLIKSFPKTPRTWSEASLFSGSHIHQQNKTNKLPSFIDRSVVCRSPSGHKRCSKIKWHDFFHLFFIECNCFY
jgi:hypothetical protein